MVGKIKKVMTVALMLHMAFLFSIPAFTARGSELTAHGAVFQLIASKTNLLIGEECNLTIVKVGDESAKVTDIEGIENFDVVIHNISTILYNLETYTPYIEEYYRIKANSTGVFSLKAVIDYNGKLYETNTLELTVSGRSAVEEDPVRDVFINTYISRKDAYLREKVVLVYELYSRYNVDAFGILDYVAIEDVLVKDITEDEPREEHVYINGVRFVKYEVFKLILEPSKAGLIAIPSFRLQANVLMDNSTVDGSGKSFSKPKPILLQTEKIDLNVRPLPTAGRPDNFSGIVGELQIDGVYSREELDYGDSLTLSLTAFGDCNLGGLSNVSSDSVSDFTVYETLKNTKEFVEDNQYYAAKMFDLTLVPKKVGALNIAPFSIAYFSPNTGKYEIAEFPSSTIIVHGDTLQPDDNTEEQTAIGETIRINQANYSYSSDDFIHIQINKQVLKGLLIIIVILLILVVVYILLLLNKKNQDLAIKSFYRQMMNAKNDNAAYKHLNDMFKHVYSLNLKASSKETVQSVLSDSELAEQVTDVMDYMESREDRGRLYLKGKIRQIYTRINMLRKV